ncbi:MAG: hypothetical protein EOP09_16930, partial [Proteobacteria bacterium]
MKRSMIITCLVSGAVSLSLFQNCSNVNFADSGELSSGLKAGIPVDNNDSTGVTDPNSMPSPTPAPSPSATPAPTPGPNDPSTIDPT